MSVENLRGAKLRVYNQFKERLRRIFPEEVIINNHRLNLLDQYNVFLEDNDEFNLERDDVEELIKVSEEFIDIVRRNIRQEEGKEEEMETTQEEDKEIKIDRTSSFRKGGLRKKFGI